MEAEQAADIAYNNHIKPLREQVKQLQAEKAELLERIEMALEYLPDSPHKAMNFLIPALKGDKDG